MSKYFRQVGDEGWEVRWPGNASASSRQRVEEMKTVTDHVRKGDPHEEQLRAVWSTMLSIDPALRGTAKAQTLSCV